MLREFKEFAVKGNVMDLAVGVIIGDAFGKLVDSAGNDLIMPLIGAVFGGLDFSSFFIPLAAVPAQMVARSTGSGSLVSVTQSEPAPGFSTRPMVQTAAVWLPGEAARGARPAVGLREPVSTMAGRAGGGT